MLPAFGRFNSSIATTDYELRASRAKLQQTRLYLLREVSFYFGIENLIMWP